MNFNFPSKNRYVLVAATVLIGGGMGAMLPAYAEYDVTKYGAKGDGLTDDSEAIQKAVNAAAADKADSRVVFPAGEYLYTKAITANGVTLSGRSANAHLVSGSFSACVIVSGEQPVVSYLSFTTIAPGGTAIECKEARSAKIANNFFGKGFSKAIDVHQLNSGSIKDNTFQVSQAGYGFFGSDMDSVSIAANVLSGDLESSIGIQVGRSKACKIEDNRLNSFRCGIELTGSSQCELNSNQVSGASVGLEMNRTDNSVCNSNHVNVAGDGIMDDRNRDTSIESNIIVAGRFGIFNYGGQSCTISQNRVQGGDTGLVSDSTLTLEVDSNRIDGVTGNGIEIRRDKTAVLTSNTVRSSGKVGVLICSTSNPDVVGNTIGHTQKQGIYEADCTGRDRIQGNTLTDCGLNAEEPAAVVFVNSSKAMSIQIVSNHYSGNQEHLKYYIQTFQTPPTVAVSGNRTDTLLPNKIGR